LEDRASSSILGNSDHALQYLLGHFGAEDENLRKFLERTPERREWERSLNVLGHTIQVYVYHFILGPDSPGDIPLCMWGAFEPGLPIHQRIYHRIMYPFTRKVMYGALKLDDAAHVARAKTLLQEVCSDTTHAASCY